MANVEPLTRELVEAVLNDAADEICDAAGLPDSGARDALNLLVNTAAYRLFTDPKADLETIVEHSYDDNYAEVLGWIEG